MPAVGHIMQILQGHDFIAKRQQIDRIGGTSRCN